MHSEDEQKRAQAPAGEDASTPEPSAEIDRALEDAPSSAGDGAELHSNGDDSRSTSGGVSEDYPQMGESAVEAVDQPHVDQPHMDETDGSVDQPADSTTTSAHTDDSYGYYEDPYSYEAQYETPVIATEEPKADAPAPAAAAASGSPPPPPSPPEDDEDSDSDDDGMLRMSFLEHLEELRKRLMLALLGIGVAFAASLIFAHQLWAIVAEPAIAALHELGFQEKLWQHKPMETFSVVWVKLPLLTSIFLASPWVLYQVWAFIAPGLYKRERRWAAPFVIVSAGLFIMGGLFAYFVAFRFGLTFLLGIGRDIHIAPVVSVTEYFDLFVNVTLGIGLVFELPVLIFFLTLLRVASPGFLLRNSRYAILVIVLLAALITPTPDIFNLMIFSVPMVLLFFIGVFASYLLVLHRENRRFPWRIVLGVLVAIAAVAAALGYMAISVYGYKLMLQYPFLTR